MQFHDAAVHDLDLGGGGGGMRMILGESFH